MKSLINIINFCIVFAATLLTAIVANEKGCLDFFAAGLVDMFLYLKVAEILAKGD